jgi:AraC-like DNA-binding protein
MATFRRDPVFADVRTLHGTSSRRAALTPSGFADIARPFRFGSSSPDSLALRNGGRPSPAFADAIATVIAYRVGLGAATGRGALGQESVPAFSSAQLARIERFVGEHLDQPIRLLTLAEFTDLSVWHFLRRFSASYGLPPHAFITERRLARAQALLAESKLTITEIALEIGMSHSHFSRTFLKRFGVSPREFRRQRQS